MQSLLVRMPATHSFLLILAILALLALQPTSGLLHASRVAAVSGARLLSTPQPLPHVPDPSLPPKREPFPTPIPTVGLGKDQNDIISHLLKERILFLGSEVTDDVANVMVAQMLFLAAADPKADITLYINSPGGSVQAGLAIFDAMQYVPCDIRTVCIGMAASMGAFLLASGTPGKRRSLPNARIMIHQPLGGSQGESSDLEISAKLMLHTKAVLNTYLAAFCRQPADKIRADTERDFYMTPEEALHYGLVDEVITHKVPVARPRMPSLSVQSPLPLYDLSSVGRRPADSPRAAN